MENKTKFTILYNSNILLKKICVTKSNVWKILQPHPCRDHIECSSNVFSSLSHQCASGERSLPSTISLLFCTSQPRALYKHLPACRKSHAKENSGSLNFHLLQGYCPEGWPHIVCWAESGRRKGKDQMTWRRAQHPERSQSIIELASDVLPLKNVCRCLRFGWIMLQILMTASCQSNCQKNKHP